MKKAKDPVTPVTLKKSQDVLNSEHKFKRFLLHIYENIDEGDIYWLDANQFKNSEVLKKTVRLMIKHEKGALFLSIFSDGNIKVFK